MWECKTVGCTENDSVSAPESFKRTVNVQVDPVKGGHINTDILWRVWQNTEKGSFRKKGIPFREKGISHEKGLFVLYLWFLLWIWYT